jgi:hypothetical protein
MTITNGYASRAQLQLSLNIAGSTDADLLDEAIESGAREIDKFCGRRFYTDTNASARLYAITANGSTGIRSERLAVVHDFYTATGLVIKTDTGGDGSYATTWSTSDYELRPLNGIVDGESGWPYWEIHAIGGLRFPCHNWRGPSPLQTTAKWGWAAVPAPVYQAQLILGRANYKLKDAAFGSVGIADLGVITVTQVPAAAKKLQPYRTGAAAVMVA